MIPGTHATDNPSSRQRTTLKMKHLPILIAAVLTACQPAHAVTAQELCYRAGSVAKEMHEGLRTGKIDEAWLVERATLSSDSTVVVSTIYTVLNNQSLDTETVRRMVVLECLASSASMGIRRQRMQLVL